MKEIVARSAKDKSGTAAIEYGLIAAGIAVAIVVVLNAVGTHLNTLFDVGTRLGGQ